MNAKSPTVVIYGGAGAGKSWATAQFLLLRFLKEKNKHFLITRKTTPSLRLSCYLLVKNFIREMGVVIQENRVDMTLFFGENMMVFRGLDDPEKIKSAEFNYVWMEEATEFDLEDYRQLKLRLRRKTDGINQIFLTFNPLFNSWLYDLVMEKKEPADILQVNYRDNLRFLSQEYVRQLEDLKNQDLQFYKIYNLGEFAQPTNLIYTNWEVCHSLPEKYDEIIYGLDFGFVNPTCLLKIGLRDEGIYILDEFYRSGVTNLELIAFLNYWKVSGEIYADAAEPARIAEIRANGFNCMGADKAVKNGIDYIRRKKIFISPSCPNFLKEIRNYKWKEGPKGILDEPVKFMDHAMDALRYAVYTHSLQGGVGIRIL